MGDGRVPLWSAVGAVIERAPLGSDEKLRLQHYTLLLALGLPSMSAFAVALALRGERTLAAGVFFTVTMLALGWVLIGRGVRPVLVYRVNYVVFCSLLLVVTAVGGADGSMILWTYAFPLIGFFLMGRREGLVWVAVLYVCVAVIVLDLVPGVRTHAYAGGFRARYLVTQFIVAAIAYGFETFREQYRLGMEAERARLQEALDQVRTLSGLLPICSSCKKIRDDQGYWNQLEWYLHERADVRFSHGICPECARQLYPDLDLSSDDIV